jgi:carbon-monoxide dehydrogenase small subunit
VTLVRLLVNGTRIEADPAPRQHLADFLREHLLLTGTHLGCEHGVCGACTILLDGEPARGCITYAAACDGAEIRTIEGLQDDPLAARLRAAFTAEHALQCGYCTPGMLVTARDIVRRLPDASDDEVRLELAGNLCRCTGYNGIVRAIRRVLDERMNLPPLARPALPNVSFGPVEVSTVASPVEVAPPDDGMRQHLRFAVPADELWRAVRDPMLIASCVPGATLESVLDDAIAGAMVVSLGPVRARFVGAARVSYDETARSGVLRGGGRDAASGTLLSGAAVFRVTRDGAGSALDIEIEYALRGALSQLARPRIVALLAGEIAAMFAVNLAARLRGDAVTPGRPLSGLALMARVVWRWLRVRFR